MPDPDLNDRQCNIRPCTDPATVLFRGVWPETDSQPVELTAWLTDMTGRHVRACQAHTPQCMAQLAALDGCPNQVRAVPIPVAVAL